MAATLPSKAVDDEGGKMRFAVYVSILRDHSNDALSYMAWRACVELDWFPTPKQCLAILRDYHPPASEAQQALQLCHNFWQRQFEDFIRELEHGTADQATIDSVPERWRRIAVERGYLRYLLEENRYIIRTRAALA